MTSNIFDEHGSDKSVYSASRQKDPSAKGTSTWLLEDISPSLLCRKELLENLRQSYVQKNGVPEAMNLPRRPAGQGSGPCDFAPDIRTSHAGRRR